MTFFHASLHGDEHKPVTLARGGGPGARLSLPNEWNKMKEQRPLLPFRSLEWTTAELAPPRFGYIRRGLNGIKDSADVSQMKTCPLGFCCVGPLFFYFINEQPGSKVEEPEDPTDTTLTQTSAQPSFGVQMSEEIWSNLEAFFCSAPRFLIMLRELFYEVPTALKMLCPCVSHPLLLCCIGHRSPGRKGILAALVKPTGLPFLFLHKAAPQFSSEDLF